MTFQALQPKTVPQGGDIWDALRKYTRSLDEMDTEAFKRLARTYREALPDIQAQVSKYGDLLSTARSTGVQPSASWVFQHQRYLSLEQQVVAGIGDFSVRAGGIARAEQLKALAAQDSFFQKMATGQASFGNAGDLRSWARLPDRTLQAFAGLSTGNPLFAKFAAEAGRDSMYAMRNTLGGAIASGRDWRSTARLMEARVAGITLTRARTITRTEVARARRAAALATFQVNPAVKSWVWRAALDKSCPACIALHGREFPNDEMQAGHPNCRCVMIPQRQRGTNVDVGTGSDYLFQQLQQGGPARLNEVLGKGRATWWKNEMNSISAQTGMPLRLAGQQALGKMATFQSHAQYGGMYRPTTMWRLRGGPPPNTGLPPTPAPSGPGGGFSAKPDYGSTTRATQWMNAEGRAAGGGVKDWGFGDEVYDFGAKTKAAAQAKVFDAIRLDPRMRTYVETNRKRLIGSGNINMTEAEYEAGLKAAIREMVDTWSGTSGDSNPYSVALQYAAQKEFNLVNAFTAKFGSRYKGQTMEGGIYDTFYSAVKKDAYGSELLRPAAEWDDEIAELLARDETFMRTVLRAQYEITQREFRDAGITHITLFRSAGTSSMNSTWTTLDRMRLQGGVDRALANLELQPLSSFTSKPSVTGGFGNTFYQTTVPVEYIHSTARTGLGCLSEWEFVVMDADLAPATLIQMSQLQSKYDNFFRWSPYNTPEQFGQFGAEMLGEATVPLK